MWSTRAADLKISSKNRVFKFAFDYAPKTHNKTQRFKFISGLLERSDPNLILVIRNLVNPRWIQRDAKKMLWLIVAVLLSSPAPVRSAIRLIVCGLFCDLNEPQKKAFFRRTHPALWQKCSVSRITLFMCFISDGSQPPPPKRKNPC